MDLTRSEAIVDKTLADSEVVEQAPKKTRKRRAKKSAKKTLGTNPKDAVGSQKVGITKFPASALILGARAMMNGAAKYGPYNWRGNKVIASIYVDAAMRHLLAWNEREENAKDSGVHHLGHALATIAVVLDAQQTGNMVDDRPEHGNAPELLETLNQAIKESNA